MSEKAILVTGASGEVGVSLTDYFLKEGGHRILALDLHGNEHRTRSTPGLIEIQGDITDRALVRSLFSDHDIRKVFHLAAVLSKTAESHPARAHDVNVNGSFYLLQAAHDHAQKIGEPVQFIFPSSIAVYGIPSPEAKRAAGAVREDQFLTPVTMYGLNKLYIENIGRYYSGGCARPGSAFPVNHVDFRALRLPGLLSCDTVPTGGTSDYAPQMVHACAQRQPYASFAAPHATIPFMAMADAVRAMLLLSNASRDRLTQTSYNVTAFAVSAEQVRQELLKSYPDASITYAPDPQRECILDTWPEDTDDARAREDWGWQPEYTFESCFRDYLIPGISQQYR